MTRIHIQYPDGSETPAEATVRRSRAASAFVEKAEAALDNGWLAEADAWRSRAAEEWEEAGIALRAIPFDAPPAVRQEAEAARSPIQGRMTALSCRLREAKAAVPAPPKDAPPHRVAYIGHWLTLTLPLAFVEDHAARCYGGLPDGDRAQAECCAVDGCACLIQLARRRARYGKDRPGRIGPKARTVRLLMTPDAVSNLRSDAGVYADLPEAADDPDLARLARSAAATLRALDRAEATR